MTELHHVALGAWDVARIAAFYREAFRLEPDREHYDEDGRLRSIWLRLGSGRLMIEHTEAERPSVEGVDKGPFLLAFSVTAEEKAAAEERLERLGAPICMRTEFTSYARDPEGNRVALSHFPQAG